ncbi:hypothetical protein AVEN_7847-1 [Araneus ventricosus]|uniref:Uncharacterized protein n=1 Tax=Araneus ventricosus TaxID=182803 RepID=A0A4Y2F2Q4_ARAVE|nr:hypothetical protein AVEN_7847-1 [Araneus ventricosus]
MSKLMIPFPISSIGARHSRVHLCLLGSDSDSDKKAVRMACIRQQVKLSAHQTLGMIDDIIAFCSTTTAETTRLKSQRLGNTSSESLPKSTRQRKSEKVKYLLNTRTRISFPISSRERTFHHPCQEVINLQQGSLPGSPLNQQASALVYQCSKRPIDCSLIIRIGGPKTKFITFLLSSGRLLMKRREQPRFVSWENDL